MKTKHQKRGTNYSQQTEKGHENKTTQLKALDTVGNYSK